MTRRDSLASESDVLTLTPVHRQRWRETRAAFDALLRQVDALDHALSLELEAQANALVTDLTIAFVVAAIQQLADEWDWLPRGFRLNPDLGPAKGA
jgi:hypothetical protein